MSSNTQDNNLSASTSNLQDPDLTHKYEDTLKYIPDMQEYNKLYKK